MASKMHWLNEILDAEVEAFEKVLNASKPSLKEANPLEEKTEDIL